MRALKSQQISCSSQKTCNKTIYRWCVEKRESEQNQGVEISLVAEFLDAIVSQIGNIAMRTVRGQADAARSLQLGSVAVQCEVQVTLIMGYGKIGTIFVSDGGEDCSRRPIDRHPAHYQLLAQTVTLLISIVASSDQSFRRLLIARNRTDRYLTDKFPGRIIKKDASSAADQNIVVHADRDAADVAAASVRARIVEWRERPSRVRRTAPIHRIITVLICYQFQIGSAGVYDWKTEQRSKPRVEHKNLQIKESSLQLKCDSQSIEDVQIMFYSHFCLKCGGRVKLRSFQLFTFLAPLSATNTRPLPSTATSIGSTNSEKVTAWSSWPDLDHLVTVFWRQFKVSNSGSEPGPLSSIARPTVLWLLRPSPVNSRTKEPSLDRTFTKKPFSILLLNDINLQEWNVERIEELICRTYTVNVYWRFQLELRGFYRADPGINESNSKKKKVNFINKSKIYAWQKSSEAAVGTM